MRSTFEETSWSINKLTNETNEINPLLNGGWKKYKQTFQLKDLKKDKLGMSSAKLRLSCASCLCLDKALG